MVPVRDGHAHDLVGGHPEQLLLLLAVEADDEEGDAEVRQRLPRLDEVHLGLQQVQVLHVGVRLQDLLAELRETQRVGHPVRFFFCLFGKVLCVRTVPPVSLILFECVL